MFSTSPKGAALSKIVVDAQGKPIDYITLEVNEAWEQLVGVKRQQAIGKRITDIIPGIDKDPFDWIGKYGKVALQGGSNAFEAYFVPHNKYYEVSVFSPKQGYFLATFFETTDRKKAEQALKESQTDLVRAQKLSQTGNWRVTIEGNIFWSDQTYRMFGIPIGTPMNYEHFLDIVYPEDREYVRQKWRQTQEGEPYDVKHRIVVNGKIKWVRETAELEFKDGSLVSGFGTVQDITKSKMAEDALRDSEERFRLVAEAANVLVYELDFIKNKLKIIRGENILGYKTGEIPSGQEWWLNQIHPEDMDTIQQRAITALETGRDEMLEYRMKRKQGDYIIVHDTAKMVKDSQGRVARLIGGLRDVTERRKSEEALKENEQLYRTLFDNTNDSFAIHESIFDKNGNLCDYRILRVNKAYEQAYERQTGLIAADMIGKPVSEVIPDLEKSWFVAFDEVAKNGKSIRFENYNARTDRWYDVYAFPFNKGRFGVLFRDITKRKQADAELLHAKEQSDQQRRRLETIVETSPSAIVIFNSEGKMVALNKRARELYEIDGSLTRGNLERLKPKRPNGSSYPEENLPTAKALQGQVIRNERVLLQKADGTVFPIIASAAPIFDATGKVASAVLIFDDISGRVRLEQELENQQRLAAIGATAGMVGHDIRNPLQAMIGDVYLLKDFLESMPEMPMKKEVAESLDSIEKNIGYVNKIVADLQDYARPLNPECTAINLYELVTSVFQPISLPENIMFSLDLEPDFTFKSDPTLVRRILSNLIINAIQAMQNGGKLCISGCPHGDKVLLIVEDTGVGIPEEVKPKLFTPMLTTKAKGQGLGLAVVKRLVESLGGTIGFESQVGVGTKFVIELPLN